MANYILGTAKLGMKGGGEVSRSREDVFGDGRKRAEHFSYKLQSAGKETKGLD